MSVVAALVVGSSLASDAFPCLDHFAPDCPAVYSPVGVDATCDGDQHKVFHEGESVEYHVVDEKITWGEALNRCQELNPNWRHLAIVNYDWEWDALVKALRCAANNDHVDADFYTGAWVGFSSPEPIPSAGLCAGGVRNPPCKPQYWNWIDPTNGNDPRGGPNITNDTFAFTKWGGLGTGVDSLPQPDNSGGEQRCGLVAFGGIIGKAPEPYMSYSPDPFWDDQNCYLTDRIINRNRFVCESIGSAPPPEVTPPLPPPFPPPVPPGCAYWCNAFTCGDSRCALCGSCGAVAEQPRKGRLPPGQSAGGAAAGQCATQLGLGGDYVQFFVVDELKTWAEAAMRCPEICADCELATLNNEAEWEEMTDLLDCVFSQPGANVGYYNGGWIGLNSPDPLPTGDVGGGPWTPADNWRWVAGSDRAGRPISPWAATKWGPTGTGWGGGKQPDNSGGYQRCSLIAIGVNSMPVTTKDPFIDDQNCGDSGEPIINKNRFFCETRTAPQPGPPPSPPAPPPFPPPVPPGCSSWCNAYTCGFDSCSSCGPCIARAAGAYCAMWCNSFTSSFAVCAGC